MAAKRPAHSSNEQMAQDYIHLFGLYDWHVTVKEVDEPGGGPGNDGYCLPQVRYLMATIEVRKGLTDERRRYVMLHEMQHIAHAHTWELVHQIVKLLPKGLQEHALELYKTAEEQQIERTTRALISQHR